MPALMKQNQKQNRKEITYKSLKQAVLTLELTPGAAIDEVELSKQYGLSRTPLREVFQRLAGEGYIKLESNKGASVSAMDMATMRNFFQSAPMIYAAIARLAVEQSSHHQIQTLKDIQYRFRGSVVKGKASDMAVHNHRFHEHIGLMAASPYLTPSLGRLLIDHTRMSQRFYRLGKNESRGRIDEACDQHDAMIEAFEQQDPGMAVELTLQHWELSRQDIDKYVFPESLTFEISTPGTSVPEISEIGEVG